ncbi:phosphoribosylanthranilate isomerase [Priestia megaterium]|nr:phosphoribosylanthranilate isomerase [Priestia megaterium]
MLIKYCGIKTIQDLHLAEESLAHYIGFIFYRNSKRYVSPSDARQISNQRSKSALKLVGVFVNEEVATILKVAAKANLHVIQCHGQETTSQLQQIKAHGYEVWKALPHDEHTITQMNAYEDTVDGYVIDSKVKDQFGGTGVTFNWGFVPAYMNVAKRFNKKCFIAGGITADNISNLLSYQPIGIDLSSGIERNGVKNKQKIIEIERKILHDIQSS